MTKIEIPPSRGVGRVWIFLPPGWSTAPNRVAKDLTSCVRNSEGTKATTKRNKYFSIVFRYSLVYWLTKGISVTTSVVLIRQSTIDAKVKSQENLNRFEF